MKFGYASKQDRFETPVGEFHPVVHGGRSQLYSPHRPPRDEYQALMEAAPLQDVPMTEQEREQDWAGFQQKLDEANLTEREEIVISCVVLGGMSLAQTARIIGEVEGKKPPSKMSVMRIRDRAYSKLRSVFERTE